MQSIKKTVIFLIIFLNCIFLKPLTCKINDTTCLSLPACTEYRSRFGADTITQVNTVWVRTKDGESFPVRNITEIHANTLELIKNQLFDSVVVIDGKFIRSITTIPPNKLSFTNMRSLPKLSWRTIFAVMNFEYNPVEGLLFNEQFEFCKPYSLSLHNSIQSNDGNFIAWIEHYFTGIEQVSREEGISIDSVVSVYNSPYKDIDGLSNNYLRRIPLEVRNTRYIQIIRDHLIDIAEKYKRNDREKITIDDLKNNIEYVSPKDGQMPFDADIVIKYPLPVKPVNGDKYFQKRYSHCEVLLLQKNDVGPIVFYCFFTKDGYMKREDYFSQLEKAFYFDQKFGYP